MWRRPFSHFVKFSRSHGVLTRQQLYSKSRDVGRRDAKVSGRCNGRPVVTVLRCFAEHVADKCVGKIGNRERAYGSHVPEIGVVNT